MSKKCNCPSCGSANISVFYEVQNVPVNSCLLLSTEEEAQNFPRGSVVLGFCESCGFIYNTAFNPSLVNYSSAYEDQQSYSPTFNTFAQKLAKHLVKKHDLYNKTIVEIGCGKGDFLALLCELGNNTGVGIDPAFISGRIQSSAENRLTFIRDYYSERYTNYKGDLICCRHTLEHIPNTAEFIGMVRRAVGGSSEPVIFFEIPDVARVLRELAFWDIYYEHCSYFSPGSLARLFRRCRFEVSDLYRDFDNQYLLIEAKPVSQPSTKVHGLEESVEQIAQDVEYYLKHANDKISNWKDRLERFRSEKARIVIWGSGSKCVAFMATLDIKDEIEYVVDINPHRHGKFLPGVGKKIVSPDFLKAYKPAYVIVMNRVYCNEIKQKLSEMNVAAEVIPV
jgi:SAM-dependent methyltransferase